MKIPDTEPSGMPEEKSVHWLWAMFTGEFPWFQSRGPHAYMFAVVATGALLLVCGAVIDRPELLIAAQYVFLVTGAVQILAAVYLSSNQAGHLRSLIAQEKQKPTEFVRPVQLTRAKMALLVQLRSAPVLNINDLLGNIAAAEKKYVALEDEQSSTDSDYLVLAQADIGGCAEFCVTGVLVYS